MSKRIFILIVVLMSISLLGIIFVQLYWISNAIESKDQQFDSDVKIALTAVSTRISDKEEEQVFQSLSPILNTEKIANQAQIKNYLIQQIDTISKSSFSFGATILEEDYKVPFDFLDNDSIILKRITQKNDVFKAKIFQNPDKKNQLFNEERFSEITRRSDLEKKYLSSALIEWRNIKPIYQRVNSKEINSILEEEFRKRNINIEFKFAVYNEGLATPIKSGYFAFDKSESYNYPLFLDEKGNSEYNLYVDFPEKRKHILSGVSYILLLSLFFIIIIVLAFSSSLYQSIKQRKISEIKTDFINNMTHEFKTPIATISLALDSIKNPKIIEKKERILRYIKMIRDENKRMHDQVENVLRVSRLEKNKTEISKDTLDIHDIIEDAVSHVNLLTLDKKGTITTHYNAIQSEVLANQFHMSNVLINILENALKYSLDSPKIDVYTESTDKNLTIKIKDEGIGMSKQTQRYVFDEFYREQKGNIHDVKGHGLGLAYAKKIIDNHHGTIFVESEKGKGSTFTVKLPLI